MRRSLLAILVVLAFPGSALAETTTVDASSTGGCARGGTCKGISQALGVSQAGDTLSVKKGSYVEDPTVTLANLTIDAETGAAVRGTLTLNQTATVHGLTVLATAGGSAITAATNATLTDVIAVSTTGSALTINGGTSRVQRSTLASLEPSQATSDGIKLGAATLAVDSSVVLPGAKGAGLRVTTAASSANAAATLNHVTMIAGADAKAIVLDGSGGPLPLFKVGDIALTVNSSIVKGATTSSSDPGLSPLREPNSVTTTMVKSDTTSAPGDVFSTPTSFRLKFGSSLIDKGAAALAAGESATDVDGDERVAGAASDIGADEFVNHPPVITLSVLPASVHTGQVVNAFGRATDREGASDIAAFGTLWGDGTKRDVTQIGAVAHSFADPGTYTVSMAAIDRSGAVSNVATQQVTVTDADPPFVNVSAPKPGAVVRLNSNKGHKRLVLRGAAIDGGGVASVEVALTKLGDGKTCLQYVGKAFGKGKCTAYVFRQVPVANDKWTLQTDEGVVIPAGSYEARVRATDLAGNKTTTFDKKQRSLVRFRVK